jgi:hypothetical protein
VDYQANFKGWDKLTLADLAIAYRKAKADCFSEGGFPSSAKFAAFEDDLVVNLEALLNNLQNISSTNDGFLRSLSGETRLVPKKLKIDSTSDDGHAHFSSPQRAVKQFFNDSNVTAEFRIIGDFSVETHIFSALWINMIGHKFDACLNNDDIYGARLKRIHSDEGLKSERTFHISAIGSFQPYYQPYRKWRQDGLDAIRTELDNDRDIIAISLDLKGYYHFIDPTFITKPKLLETIGLSGDNSLSEAELTFTKSLVSILKSWSKKASKFAETLQNQPSKLDLGGLVIGLTASRIISNILLWQWDKVVREELTPIHYGRYVDDMFLVLADGGKVNSTKSLMAFLSSRLKYVSGKKTKSVLREEKDDLWIIDFPKNLIAESTISLQSTKQKLFILSGQSGIDLVDSIEKEIGKLSSEHRLLPSPDYLAKSTAAKVLSATNSTADSADTFRKADGMSMHRLSWAIQLRQIETIARDLPKLEWKEERNDFYRFAHDYIIRADKIFDQFSYLPRLLAIAISIEDWEQAYKIVEKSYDALDELSLNTSTGITINGHVNFSNSDLIWSKLKATAAFQFIDAAASSFPIIKPDYQPSKKLQLLAQKLMDKIFDAINFNDDSLNDILSPFIDGRFYDLAPKLQRLDLSKRPYKRINFTKSKNTEIEVSDEVFSQQVSLFRILKNKGFIDNSLIRFVLKSQVSRYGSRVKRLKESIYPFLFPTRPYNAAEILTLEPNFKGTASNLRSLIKWAKYVKAVRGVWVKQSLLTSSNGGIQKNNRLINIGTGSRKSVRVAVTSMKTSMASWSASAVDKPNLSIERYKQLCHLINSILTSYPKPDYVLLPELSLPLNWVTSISNRLSQSGIGLIAGTEYKHVSDSTVHSEALLSLADDRLGYPIWCQYRQPKLLPAVAEDKELQTIHGKEWHKFSDEESVKPIYKHNGFHFGVMVCSELQNSKDRIAFQGKIDSLFVLSWNQDLETFSALLEATALDVHAYSVLVNNRSYGDSRVRSPAKESFKRDLARIKGGENDYFVTVTLDLKSLREFQSRASRWTTEDDKFKPVPEGFELLKSREIKPAK